mmetsp:Transcript_104875/g.338231  ORF Transcript_104875/g.338231 Transcript_104875/m.338231 type:complete len:440 (+) Transcript_104875:212-1531(+)
MEVRSEFGRRYIPADAESDLLRLALLYRHGGCWADSTMLCRRPLDDWLPQATEASGCFAFAPEDLAENVPVVSSFLAAEQGHVVVKQWLRRVIDYWLFPVALRPDLGFFWLHRLFGQLIAGSDPYGGVRDNEGDASARRAWNNVPRVTGEYGRPGPHFWVVYNKRLRAPATPEYLDIIQHDEETPMWKLTNREVNLREVGAASCYRVLLEVSRRQARAHAWMLAIKSSANALKYLGLTLATAECGATLTAATDTEVVDALTKDGNWAQASVLLATMLQRGVEMDGTERMHSFGTCMRGRQWMQAFSSTRALWQQSVMASRTHGVEEGGAIAVKIGGTGEWSKALHLVMRLLWISREIEVASGRQPDVWPGQLMEQRDEALRDLVGTTEEGSFKFGKKVSRAVVNTCRQRDKWLTAIEFLESAWAAVDQQLQLGLAGPPT